MSQELEDCAWCFEPATSTVVVQVTSGDDEHLVDFCPRHLDELLTGARPQGRATKLPGRS